MSETPQAPQTPAPPPEGEQEAPKKGFIAKWRDRLIEWAKPYLACLVASVAGLCCADLALSSWFGFRAVGGEAY